MSFRMFSYFCQLIVENIDDDYLKIGNSLIQSVRINDDLIEDDIVYFIDK